MQAKSPLTPYDTMGLSPPGSCVHGILQARILEGVAVPSSTGSSPPRDRTYISSASCVGRRVLGHQRHLGSLQKGMLSLKRQPILQLGNRGPEQLSLGSQKLSGNMRTRSWVDSPSPFLLE